MNDQNQRQQIVEKIQNSNNILVTVSKNPSVDELSAALGLTVMLNNMNKHATAVFSGQVPRAIDFLSPGKTFENTVDSLRDFIIALDKEKADHLRYKVEGEVVKIFITPYRTTIGEKDLEFSQGDYNIELVIALGVTNQESLDQALEAHGRIFHDATVATVTVGGDRSSLGSIDWNERSASSLSEMMVGLSDALRTDRSLLDEQTATAYLTGIVAMTNRFSNNLTSSKVMTIAAQLMAAGANQQLIATKLEEAEEIEKEQEKAAQNSDGSTDLTEGESSKVNKKQNISKKGKKLQPTAPVPEAEEPKKEESHAGELLISHEKQGDLDEVARQTHDENLDQSAQKAEEALSRETPAANESLPPLAADEDSAQVNKPQDAQADSKAPKSDDTSAKKSPEQELAEQLAGMPDVATAKAGTPSVADLQKDLAAASADVEQAAQEPVNEPILPPLAQPQPPAQPQPRDEPTLGGTLNATTEQAAEDKRREEKNDRNRTILSHNSGEYVGNQTPTYSAPLNATVDPGLREQKPLADPMAGDTQPTAPAAPIAPPASAGMTLADLDEQNRSPHDEARSAIDAAFAMQDQVAPQTAPEQPQAQQFTAPAAPNMPPLPDFSTLPPLPPQFGGQSDNFAQFQPPVQSQPRQAPQATQPQPAPSASSSAPLPPTGVSDPGQFKIPS